MNHKKIVRRISEKLNIPIHIVDKVINSSFIKIKELLSKDSNIMLRGYFKFVTSKRKYYQKPDKLNVEQIIKLPNKK
jgi:nucleoid DNA-binding protein|tara:strand:+ start:401 stop:631 length:231 start_codon:yes stop_codon:yes gene_type:complete